MFPHRRRKGFLKALRLLKSIYHDYPVHISNKLLQRFIKTRSPCSCSMCGNPRKKSKDKLTLQEKKELITFEEEKKDVGG